MWKKLAKFADNMDKAHQKEVDKAVIEKQH